MRRQITSDCIKGSWSWDYFENASGLAPRIFTFVVISTVITIATLAIVFGFGQPTESERSLLFKCFIVEVGFAVIALFYSLFRIKKNDPNNRKITSQKGTEQANMKFTSSEKVPFKEQGWDEDDLKEIQGLYLGFRRADTEQKVRIQFLLIQRIEVGIIQFITYEYFKEEYYLTIGNCEKIGEQIILSGKVKGQGSLHVTAVQIFPRVNSMGNLKGIHFQITLDRKRWLATKIYYKKLDDSIDEGKTIQECLEAHSLFHEGSGIIKEPQIELSERPMLMKFIKRYGGVDSVTEELQNILVFIENNTVEGNPYTEQFE